MYTGMGIFKACDEFMQTRTRTFINDLARLHPLRSCVHRSPIFLGPCEAVPFAARAIELRALLSHVASRNGAHSFGQRAARSVLKHQVLCLQARGFRAV